jgi:hypothetical protein
MGRYTDPQPMSDHPRICGALMKAGDAPTHARYLTRRLRTEAMLIAVLSFVVRAIGEDRQRSGSVQLAHHRAGK